MLGFLHWKKRDKDTEEFYAFFKNILGFKPRNVDLYKLAFLHKSKSKEMHHGIKLNNERLEYLGDAVLSAVIADFLFKKYPYQGEGFLTEMSSLRSECRESCDPISRCAGRLKQVREETFGIFSETSQSASTDRHVRVE